MSPLVLLLLACRAPAPPPPASPAPAAAPAPPATPAPAAAPEPRPRAESAGRHDWPGECASPSDPNVRYEHPTWAERELCARMRFHCDPGWSPFSGECGCGCTRDEPVDGGAERGD